MMKKFTRPLFAVLMMILVAAALILATLSWVESCPGRVHSATETTETTETPAMKLAESCSTNRDSTFIQP